MTEAAIRFKPKSAPYRRGGLAFTTIDAWVERAPADLVPRDVAVLAADARIVIEVRETPEADWTPLVPEARELAAAQLQLLDDQDWAEISAEMIQARSTPAPAPAPKPKPRPVKGKAVASTKAD
jgi:hypothetical protein